MGFRELERLLDNAEALAKYKETKSEVAVLRGQLKKAQDELSKHKDLRIQFAGEEITWEDFERKVREQTQKVYGEEIDAKVKRGMNETFWANVQATINNAKQEEWPRFLDDYTRKKITPLGQSKFMNWLMSTNRMVTKACDKCGTVNAFSLTPDNIAHLIKHPHIRGDCLNPQCVEGLFKSRHKIHVSLGDLIMQLVGNPNMPQPPRYGSVGKKSSFQ